MQSMHFDNFFQLLYLCEVVVTGELKCERKAEMSCKSEERVENCTLKVIKMSGKLMAIGC